jgi:glyoxalase family protein
MQLTGFHHLTAITANAAGNHNFYTAILGLRLVKKTVNQDDVSAYHLFYADAVASPGTDITFFDWPVGPERRGTNCISRVGLRVAAAADLEWWLARFEAAGIAHDGIAERDGRAVLDFEDPEGQRLSLVVDGGLGPSFAWDRSPVPAGRQIRGLGPVTLSVPTLEPTEIVLCDLLEMRRTRTYERGATRLHVYEMGEGGTPETELHVAVEPDLPQARQGAGAVHHLALRTPDEDSYNAWADRLRAAGVPSSGPVDRYYFRSLYFREPNGILIEIATDGPGFATDEPLEHLGERLALPPFLEPRRASIEAGLKPLVTPGS